jgi:hypothetical protein
MRFSLWQTIWYCPHVVYMDKDLLGSTKYTKSDRYECIMHLSFTFFSTVSGTNLVPEYMLSETLHIVIAPCHAAVAACTK